MSRDLDELLSADESVVFETRQHWYVVLHHTFVRLLLLLLLGGGIWLIRQPSWLDNAAGKWLGYAVWLVIAGVCATLAWTILGWVTERFYVTTSRVAYARGILNRDMLAIPLVKVEEMTLRRPFLGRILGFGRLDVDNSAGGVAPLAGLEYLPRPAYLYQLIGERARNQRMIEGGAHRDDDSDGYVDQTPAPMQ